MGDQLLEVDRSVTLLINSMNNLLLDDFFIEATHRFTWIPLYIGLIWYLYRTYGLSFWRLLLVILLLITVSDQLSSFIFKPMFERLRPCNEPSITGIVHLVNDYRAGGYSFFSSHASNCTALCIFVFLMTKNYWVGSSLLLWALINGYSRIYLGVHYISDVLFGFFVGGVLGFVAHWFCSIYFKMSLKRQDDYISTFIMLSIFGVTIAYLLIT